MKRLLLFTGFLLYITLGHSQSLHKVQEIKGNASEKIVLNIQKQSGILASSLSESFESNTFPPTGWTVFTFGGSGWSRETVGTPLPVWGDSKITTPAGGGNAVAYCTYSNDSTFNDQWLVTPLIQDIQSQDTLYFWMRNQIYDYSDSVYIYYTTDGTNFNIIGQVNYPELGDTNWGKWYIHLGQYITAGSSVYIGFREFLYDNQTNGGAICLDLVEIKGAGTSAVPAVTTNNASNVTSSSATLNGTVNPNNSSTTVVFEYGTTTAYGSEITAAQSPVDGNSAVSVSANLSGLQSNTIYHYRVKGTNNIGISGGADVTFTTSSSTSAPSATTSSATNITSSSATLNGTVNPNNSSTTVVFEYGTTTAYGSEITATQSPVDGNSTVSVSANLNGLQSNTTYHYHVKGTSSGGSSSGADVTFITSQSSTNTISLNNNFTFNDPTQSSSYRMIGLPGNNNLPPTQLISGTHKTDWNMFYDNGAAENYFEEYDGSITFNFTPGRGFWVLSRKAISVNTEVNSVTLAGDDTYSINLHNGWNIITNPFNESVSLDDIKNVNVNLPANVTLWKFDGNFSQTTTLAPYEGYYFNNENNLTTLKIPQLFIIIFPKKSQQLNLIPGKNLTFKVSSQEFSSEVKIGFDPSSSNDYDEMDYMIPPGDFEELRINIVNNNLSTFYKKLFIEHRPQVGEGQKFELQIKNNTNKKAVLLVEGIEKFNEYEIYLINERLKKFYDLKMVNEIEIGQNYRSSKFSLLIGSRNFINTYKDNFVPTEFALYQNYPNPFNPSTFIRYQIPGEMHVSIKIFDVLGNLIKTLVDEVKNEGYYEDVWDASNQPSGVYFYQIKMVGFTETKKMLLIK